MFLRSAIICLCLVVVCSQAKIHGGGVNENARQMRLKGKKSMSGKSTKTTSSAEFIYAQFNVPYFVSWPKAIGYDSAPISTGPLTTSPPGRCTTNMCFSSVTSYCHSRWNQYRYWSFP